MLMRTAAQQRGLQMQLCGAGTQIGAETVMNPSAGRKPVIANLPCRFCDASELLVTAWRVYHENRPWPCWPEGIMNPATRGAAVLQQFGTVPEKAANLPFPFVSCLTTRWKSEPRVDARNCALKSKKLFTAPSAHCPCGRRPAARPAPASRNRSRRACTPAPSAGRSRTGAGPSGRRCSCRRRISRPFPCPCG